MKDREEDRSILIGIISWGSGCGKERHPAIYSKIDHVLPWIHRYMSEYSNL